MYYLLNKKIQVSKIIIFNLNSSEEGIDFSIKIIITLRNLFIKFLMKTIYWYITKLNKEIMIWDKENINFTIKMSTN